MLHLLVRTSRPFLEGLGMWMEEGKIPVGGENWFMVSKNQNVSSQSRSSSTPSSSAPTSSALPAPIAWGEGYVLIPDRIPSMPIHLLISGSYNNYFFRRLFAVCGK